MKNAKYVLILLVLLVFAVPVFAQTPAGGSQNYDWNRGLAGISMAIASGLGALGQGKAIAGAAEGTARNPAATAAIRFALILGLILIESLALYTLTIIFAKVV